MCVPAADAVTSARLGPGVCRCALRWGIGKLAGLCSEPRSRRRRHLRPVLSGPNVLLSPHVPRLCAHGYDTYRVGRALRLSFRTSLPCQSQSAQHRTSIGKPERSRLDAGRFSRTCTARCDCCVFTSRADFRVSRTRLSLPSNTCLFALAQPTCASDCLIFR